MGVFAGWFSSASRAIGVVSASQLAALLACTSVFRWGFLEYETLSVCVCVFGRPRARARSTRGGLPASFCVLLLFYFNPLSCSVVFPFIQI